MVKNTTHLKYLYIIFHLYSYKEYGLSPHMLNSDSPYFLQLLLLRNKVNGFTSNYSFITINNWQKVLQPNFILWNC